MLPIKISELGAINYLADEDILPVVDASDTTTKKVTAAQIRDFLLTSLAPGATVVSGTSFGLEPAVGTSLSYARVDHTHGTPPDPMPNHLAAPDPHNGYLLASGARALAGNWSAGTHRILSLATPVASSDAVNKAYVDSKVQGLDWQESVKSRTNNPPASPTAMARYLVDTAPTGDWAGHANAIATWNGVTWGFETPNDGWATWVEDADVLRVFNGTEWVTFGSTSDHGALSGLLDDDHPQYFLADGTRDLGGAFTVDAISAPAIAPESTGRIYFDAALNKFRVSQNGGDYVDLVTGGTVTSVTLNTSATGLTVNGGGSASITSSGTFTIDGTLDANNGGTGLTSPGAAGNVLTSDGAGNWTSAVPTGNVTGTGASGRLTLWSGTSTLTSKGPNPSATNSGLLWEVVTTGGSNENRSRIIVTGGNTNTVRLQGGDGQFEGTPFCSTTDYLRNSYSDAQGSLFYTGNLPFPGASGIGADWFVGQANDNFAQSKIVIWATNGTLPAATQERMAVRTLVAETVFNNPQNAVAFRVASQGNANMLFVDASANAVGVGTASPTYSVDVLTTTDDNGIKAVSATSNHSVGLHAQNTSSGLRGIAIKAYGPSTSGSFLGSSDANNVLLTAYGAATTAVKWGTDLDAVPFIFGNKSSANGESSGRERFRLAGDGTVVVNEQGFSYVDFRVESDNNANMLFVDASADAVGIGTSTPSALLSVAEKLLIDSNGKITKYNNVTPAKGSLLAGDASAFVAVGVGSDGQVLKADSGAAAGVSWSTPTAGITGSGVDNQIAVWSGASSLNGDGSLTWDGSALAVSGALTKTGVAAFSLYTETSSQIAVANGKLDISVTLNRLKQYGYAGLELRTDYLIEARADIVLADASGTDPVTADSMSANTLTDNTQSWVVDSLAGQFVEVALALNNDGPPEPSGVVVSGIIASNTATEITVTSPWEDFGSVYTYTIYGAQKRVRNVADPEYAQDVATKHYVDEHVAASVTTTAIATVDVSGFIALDAGTTLVDATLGIVVLTLPDATVCPGQMFVIKKIDTTANKVIVGGYGYDDGDIPDQYIDGATFYELRNQYEAVKVQSNGTQFWII